jgi:HD-GYP domain-containing protein (c-di-GMP phosphodiesterase class II)
LRVADSYAALTDNRPRRAAMKDEEARHYLVEWAGLEFDPKVVKAFLSIDTAIYVTPTSEAESAPKFRFS